MKAHKIRQEKTIANSFYSIGSCSTYSTEGVAITVSKSVRLNEMEAIDQFSLVVKKAYLLVLRTFNKMKFYPISVSAY